MNTDIEIRNEAWTALWKRNWFWKILAATLLLQICMQFILTVVNSIFSEADAFTCYALLDHIKNHKPITVLTGAMIWQLVTSSMLAFFFALITGGIANYGYSRLLVRATDDNAEGWLKAAFGGFKNPLGLAWLSFRVFLVVVFWGAIAVLPGIVATSGMVSLLLHEPATTATAIAFSSALTTSVLIFVAIMCIPFYRYRYLFRIKADKPDWPAGKCMKFCRELTCGHKWRMFKHDCSYWRIVLVAIILFMFALAAIMMAVTNLTVISALAVMVTYPLNLVILMVTTFYIGVGQTILYREILQAKQADA